MYTHVPVYTYIYIINVNKYVTFAQEMKITFVQHIEHVSGRAGQGVAEGIRSWQLCRRQHIGAGVTPMQFVYPTIYVRVCARMFVRVR